MRLHWAMPAHVRPHYKAELAASTAARAKGNLRLEWHHLERAHILGQWRMLKFGIRIKNGREVIGQVPRLVFGGVKSFVGTVPIGNTGGADVPPLKPMDLPTDLAMILDATDQR